MWPLAASRYAAWVLNLTRSLLLLLMVVVLPCVKPCPAQVTVANSITNLQSELDAGRTRLEFDPDRGYLESLLQTLKIPQSSQALVFSRTSLQREFTSPSQPRAVYFNDSVYVAYLQNGLPLEIAVADPSGRIFFYTLDQSDSAPPRFKGDTTCNLCHDPQHAGVPMLIMRSHFTDVRGYALQAQGQMSQLLFRITDQTLFSQRWGGWYVTGTHGRQLHMGNMLAPIEAERIGSNPAAYVARMDRQPGANVVRLDRFLDTKPYLTASSDIVALMILGHQVQLHNLINTAVAEARASMKLGDH